MVAICRHEGIGKTQVAAEFVHTRKDMFDAVFWVQGSSALNLQDEVSRLAISLGLVDRNSADARNPLSTQNLAKGGLANPVKDNGSVDLGPSDKASWLLVFDGIDDIDDIGILKDFWPTGVTGCVLITSQDPLGKISPQLQEVGNMIDLKPFDKCEVLSFLGKLPREQDGSGIHAKLGGFLRDAAQSKIDPDRFRGAFTSAVHLIDAVWPHEELGPRHTNSKWKDSKELFPHVKELHRYRAKLQMGQDIGSEFLFAKLLTSAGWYAFDIHLLGCKDANCNILGTLTREVTQLSRLRFSKFRVRFAIPSSLY